MVIGSWDNAYILYTTITHKPLKNFVDKRWVII